MKAGASFKRASPANWAHVNSPLGMGEILAVFHTFGNEDVSIHEFIM